MKAVTFTDAGSGADDRANGGADDRANGRAKVTRARVQFDLPPKSLARLNLLKVKTEASSYLEVIKNALRLYEALIEETESGRQFYVRDESGTMVPYRLFL